MWIPETGVSNPVYMEPIDSVERIPKARWKLQCYLCKHRMGACIQCDHRNCFTAFHVTCARRNGLLLKSQRQRATHSHASDSDDDGDAGDLLRAWCHKHVPKAVRAQRARNEEEEEEFQDASSQPRSASPTPPKRGGTGIANGTAAPGRKKSARAYKKSYRAGPTLVPAFVLNRVLDHISKIQVRKKPQLTVQIAKYWSLKREARRGAPLLKRLHLEPWTATTSNKEQSDAERVKKLQFLLRLREDLEKVRMLAELVRKREKEKLRQVQTLRSTLVDGILFPYHDHLRKALDRISALDRTGIFLHPVSVQKVPDYLDVIKEPMDWTTMASKIDAYQYSTVSDFQNDIHLVLDNSMKYNGVDTFYHRTAARIKKVAAPIFADLLLLDTIHPPGEEMRLEAEDCILELLQDYPREVVNESSDESRNAIEELTRQLNPPQEASANGTNVKVIKMSGHSRKAQDRAARSERSRLAYQKKMEAKEAQAAANTKVESEEETLNESISTSRSSKRQSVMMASMVSMEAKEQRDRRRTRSNASSSIGKSTEREESGEVDPTSLEVAQVGNKASFLRFNTGWVLPEGTKRRRLTQSSAADINGMRLPSEQLASSSSGNNISLQRQKNRQAYSSDLSEPDSPIKATSSPIVERATRGSQKRKARESNIEDDADNDEEKVNTSRVRNNRGRFVSGDTSVQYVKKEYEQGNPPTNGLISKKKAKKATSEFEPGVGCWAKLEGYPHFPAEVLDEASELVTDKVLQDKKRAVSASTEDLFLVRFFDEHRTFGWIPKSKMKLLFESDEMDQKMIASVRKPNFRSQIRASYRRAQEALL